jgi:hypothetical protein
MFIHNLSKSHPEILQRAAEDVPMIDGFNPVQSGLFSAQAVQEGLEAERLLGEETQDIKQLESIEGQNKEK